MKTSQQLQEINKRQEKMLSVMPIQSKKEQHQEGSGTVPLLEEAETLEYTKEEEEGRFESMIPPPKRYLNHAALVSRSS
jgi:hypothetical protein